MYINTSGELTFLYKDPETDNTYRSDVSAMAKKPNRVFKWMLNGEQIFTGHSFTLHEGDVFSFKTEYTYYDIAYCSVDGSTAQGHDHFSCSFYRNDQSVGKEMD